MKRIKYIITALSFVVILSKANAKDTTLRNSFNIIKQALSVTNFTLDSVANVANFNYQKDYISLKLSKSSNSGFRAYDVTLVITNLNPDRKLQSFDDAIFWKETIVNSCAFGKDVLLLKLLSKSISEAFEKKYQKTDGLMLMIYASNLGIFYEIIVKVETVNNGYVVIIEASANT